MPAEEYAKQFQSFPVKDKEVNLVPYLKARVTGVTETGAALEVIAKDGETFKEPFGDVAVKADSDTVRLVLKPVIGADFEIEGQKGRITAADDTTFTVDFNHLLAGKTVVADIEVLSIVKASALKDRQIAWIEDHDRALEESRKLGRPAILVLYADWCGWCKKLLNESAADPRVTAFKDRFVWAKVNADRQKEIGSKYGQSGFPLTVVVAPDGKVLSRIDGYRDAAALRAELEKAL
jgi:FKBP-type peptidyl-prolyl cis-trans isomerase 2